ncbi:MAG TPA: enoyl-CoA hydratase/isomerase family protein [Acidimicrobiia bacterium]
MSDEVVVDAPVEGVARITLHRPERRNALSIAVRDGFSDALDEFAGDDEVKVVVVTGSGSTFSSGFDLREFEQAVDPEFSQRLWASSDRFHRTCIEFPLPMVAAVNGPAIAGGFDLAVMCDIRVATDTARFAHPEITFGDVVYGPLHDAIGGARARELCFTGRVVEAAEALAMGLVSSVVPADRLDAEVARFTDGIVRAPRDVLLRTKAKAVRRAGVAGATLDL